MILKCRQTALYENIIIYYDNNGGAEMGVPSLQNVSTEVRTHLCRGRGDHAEINSAKSQVCQVCRDKSAQCAEMHQRGRRPPTSLHKRRSAHTKPQKAKANVKIQLNIEDCKKMQKYVIFLI